ncbi:putative hydrogenase nickel incorporation protein HypA [Desulfosarcina ovata subsp. sediminis]|uniref:Hydrogenase maturation factor HypA n=1 Tax=Desulfosarcina ovata subsp. sediminis TaxID=885957 RepID=A0A5K7ZTQ6_9BACT|nr:hydrogenase maturation nickel metallochaperone HypA [Desulfosarcina ovata]BBO83595.1 putative hydrogenase nickel incorporation protein HypA [Desulfosarcina ovata subsp. sediminis]
MHEMGIAMQIAEIATASIPADMQGARVQRVNLKVGKLSAIVADSLRFCFDLVVKETPLEGAELVIEELPVVVRCKACENQWTVTEPVFVCPVCKSGDIDILSGRELDITSIEIEDED